MSVLRKHCGRNASAVPEEQVSRELDEELNGFLEMAVDEKVKAGDEPQGCASRCAPGTRESRR